jgi:hypothetical protein
MVVQHLLELSPITVITAVTTSASALPSQSVHGHDG